MEQLDKAERDQLVLRTRAAEHFEIDETDVTAKHIQFIKDQDFALNYGYQGTPLLSYGVEENGVVAFDTASQNVLADQWDHRFGQVK